MTLRKFYKNRIKRKKVNKWNSLIEEEINNESIDNYHVSVLKGVIKHVEDNGGSILFIFEI